MTGQAPAASTAPPAFGQADLSNCEREQIHLAASIQPHGALLLLREPDLVVVQASANAAAMLGTAVLGKPLVALGGNVAAQVAPLLAQRLDTIPAAMRCTAGASATPFDALLHRPAGGGVILELERPGTAPDLSGRVERALQAILSTYAPRMLCEEAARIFRDITGYDRVMIYRFDDDGHGEVVSE